MSLPQFLNWLFGVIDRVIGFFGDRFHIYITILETIGDQINTVVNQAKAYLLDQLQRAKDTITAFVIGEVNKARDWVSTRFTQFYEWTKAQIAGVTASIGGTINDVINFINQVSAYVNTTIDEAKTGIIDFARGLINDAINSINDSYRWVLSLRDDFIGVIDYLTITVREKITYLTGMAFGTINAFVSDPIVFIFDILSDKFIDFLGWVIAVGLGSTDDNLDLTPPWKKGK